jgi:hypothetical protein
MHRWAEIRVQSQPDPAALRMRLWIPLLPIPSEHLTVIHSASQRSSMVRRASTTGPSESTGWSRLNVQWRGRFNRRIPSTCSSHSCPRQRSSPRTRLRPFGLSSSRKGIIKGYKGHRRIGDRCPLLAAEFRWGHTALSVQSHARQAVHSFLSVAAWSVFTGKSSRCSHAITQPLF